MDTLISASEIELGIPERYRRYFLVHVSPLDRRALPIIQAFWRATELLCPAAMYLHVVHVVFASAPFRIPLANGELMFTPRAEAINVAVENFIFLDCNKMAELPGDQLLPAILEELVHAMFHIGNEELAKAVVGYLTR